MTDRPRRWHLTQITHRACKSVLSVVAVLLLLLICTLVVIGFTTGWPGAKPYPPSPGTGVMMASQRIIQAMDAALYDGKTLEEAETAVSWEDVLTHWHTKEDVVLDLTSSDGERVDGGNITFKPTDDSPGFLYSVETGKFVELE